MILVVSKIMNLKKTMDEQDLGQELRLVEMCNNGGDALVCILNPNLNPQNENVKSLVK